MEATVWSKKKKHLNGGFCFLQTRRFLLHKTNNWWTGVVWITCRLLWCFYQQFELILMAPIHCRGSLVIKWWNAKFLQMCSDEETNWSRMAWGWVNWAIFILLNRICKNKTKKKTLTQTRRSIQRMLLHPQGTSIQLRAPLRWDIQSTQKIQTKHILHQWWTSARLTEKPEDSRMTTSQVQHTLTTLKPLLYSPQQKQSSPGMSDTCLS